MKSVTLHLLKKQREFMGLTQEALAELARVSLKTLQRAENNRPVSIHTAIAIASAMDLKYTDLTDETPQASSVIQTVTTSNDVAAPAPAEGQVPVVLPAFGLFFLVWLVVMTFNQIEKWDIGSLANSSFATIVTSKHLAEASDEATLRSLLNDKIKSHQRLIDNLERMQTLYQKHHETHETKCPEFQELIGSHPTSILDMKKIKAIYILGKLRDDGIFAPRYKVNSCKEIEDPLG